jgi:hypothetical protein
VAATWLLVRVDLLEGLGGVLTEPPGRVFLVGPSHTFAHLAEAIDAAFGRWDLSHLHEFGLPDGRMVGIPDDDAPAGQLDEAEVKVVAAVGPGEVFAYIFDLGDEWRHGCIVLEEKVDPVELFGARPRRPVPIDGWGWIPDQYGREAFEPDG